MPVVELVLRELLGRHLDVLFLAPGIRKAKVDEFDVLFLDRLDYISGYGGHAFLLWGQWMRAELRCKRGILR